MALVAANIGFIFCVKLCRYRPDALEHQGSYKMCNVELLIARLMKLVAPSLALWMYHCRAMVPLVNPNAIRNRLIMQANVHGVASLMAYHQQRVCHT